jgi:enamine deaminase RidA (YjgF/YER057c/UK114 family)
MEHMKLVNPDDIHAPVGAYSHSASVSSAASLLILSGQIGMRKDGYVPEKQDEQLRIALQNIQAILEAHETGIKDIIKMTFFWSDKILAPEVRNSLLLGWLGEHRPCMTMVVVKGLARPDLLVEIDVSAIGKQHD